MCVYDYQKNYKNEWQALTLDYMHEHITDHDILLILLCHRPWSVLFNIFNVSPLIYRLNLPLFMSVSGQPLNFTRN